jgi:putative hydrolase of the HAD superfamily
VTDIRCVVFDIDDTLYLERDFVRSGFRRVGEWMGHNFGIHDFDDLAWRAFEGGARGSTFDEVLRQRGVEATPALIGRLVELYRTHEPDIVLLSDARDCLEGLASRLALATVTDGPLESQRAKAGALDLTRWIDPIVFTSGLGAEFTKPHQRGFEMVQQMTGHSGAECVYIADNPLKDFIAPRTLGWKTVRVRRPQSLHQAVPSTAEVDVEVEDLSDYVDLIERLSAGRHPLGGGTGRPLRRSP